LLSFVLIHILLSKFAINELDYCLSGLVTAFGENIGLNLLLLDSISSKSSFCSFVG